MFRFKEKLFEGLRKKSQYSDKIFKFLHKVL